MFEPIRVIVDLDPDIDSKRGETYESWRERILENGGFTVFYATSTRRIANWATCLGHDPSVILTPMGFPWTKAERTPDRPEVGHV